MSDLSVESSVKDNINKFQLVLLAARRARKIISNNIKSKDPLIDKPTVMALKELKEENKSIDYFKD